MICGSSILARIRDFPFIFAALDVSEVPLISIVDDEELARDGIRELVESLGYKTNVFQSAEHFLRSSLLTETTCLITDVQMPGLSGLELQEALHSLGNQTPVIVITGYPNEKHRTRALENGAVAYLSKPFDEQTLIECLTVAIKLQSSQAWWRRTAASNECPIHVADGVLGNKCHICGFFNGLDEQHRVLRSFIKEGFERGEKAFHIMDPSLREDHLKRLTDAGIDVGHAISTGQLEVRRWQDAYLRDDRFDKDRMAAFFENLLQSKAVAGHPRMRLVSRVEPSLLDKAGIEGWLEYETRINFVLSKYDDPVICAYDLSNFSANVVMDILRVHPVVIVGGVLQENPFFVPPEQFLLELQERKLASNGSI
jgi:CheY-like chemotaxis protein